MTSLLNDRAHGQTGHGMPAGEVLRIRGGRPLSGRVEVTGAKNLATKAMVAARAFRRWGWGPIEPVVKTLYGAA